MSRSRDYIGDLPVEFVDRLMRKGRRAMSLEDLCKEFVEFKNGGR